MAKNINGQMGLGYGSKYQLLRMLGWHRNDFDRQIKKAAKLDGTVNWLDFNYEGPLDGELRNFEFLPEVDKEWKKLWVCGRGGISWDAVGIASDGTYILVEAKAHIEEMKNNKAGGNKRAQTENNRLIEKFQIRYGINSTAELWSEKHYQLANRLVAVDFLTHKGIPVRLVYVLFENGYEYNCKTEKSVSAKAWEAEIRNELNQMGISGTAAEKLINVCIINCNLKK